MVDVRRIERRELLLVPDVSARVAVTIHPSLGQILAVLALALLAHVLGIVRGLRQEELAAAAHRDLEAVAIAHLDELAGDVGAAGGRRLRRDERIDLPIAVWRVGIGGSRRRVRDPGRADRTGGHAGQLGQFGERRHFVGEGTRAVVVHDRGVDAQQVVLELDTRHHGRRVGAELDTCPSAE